jgi:hypothetical protein
LGTDHATDFSGRVTDYCGPLLLKEGGVPYCISLSVVRVCVCDRVLPNSSINGCRCGRLREKYEDFVFQDGGYGVHLEIGFHSLTREAPEAHIFD